MRIGIKWGLVAKLVMPGPDPGIHPSSKESLRRGWIVGDSPAMTKTLNSRRQHRAADQPALLQVDQRLVGLGERHRRHRNRRDLLGADQVEQFGGFAQIA